MGSVLVCVHSAVAGQAVSHAAAQLGLADVVVTAVGGGEAIAQLDKCPADVLLVDTASVRPDTVAFTRRVLERVPEATVVFFGPEEPTVARGAVAAGARGLIRGGGREDLVASVAKALLLLLRGTRRIDLTAPSAARSRPVKNESGNDAAAVHGSATGSAAGRNAVDSAGGRLAADGGILDAESASDAAADRALAAQTPTQASAPASGNGTAAMPLPLQRSEEEEAEGADSDEGLTIDGGAPPVGASGTATVEGVRRLALTERELQVLRGMADGKSNAEIGRELFVSEDTVKTHARRLFRKLGARDRAHAVAAAFRAGLVH